MIPKPDGRFWAKVDKNGPIPAYRPDLGPCWIWKGTCANGYGNVRRGKKLFLAHRVTYQALRGIIPDGLEPDHLCRVGACINPWHLELVTHKINMLRGNGVGGENARKTHCINGHPFTPENTYQYPSRQHRACRICIHEWEENRRQRKCAK